MSAYVHLNCDVCGMPFTVEEDTHHFTVIVDGKPATDCPKCGADLEAQVLAPYRDAGGGDEG